MTRFNLFNTITTFFSKRRQPPISLAESPYTAEQGLAFSADCVSRIRIALIALLLCFIGALTILDDRNAKSLQEQVDKLLSNITEFNIRQASLKQHKLLPVPFPECQLDTSLSSTQFRVQAIDCLFYLQSIEEEARNNLAELDEKRRQYLREKLSIEDDSKSVARVPVPPEIEANAPKIDEIKIRQAKALEQQLKLLESITRSSRILNGNRLKRVQGRAVKDISYLGQEELDLNVIKINRLYVEMALVPVTLFLILFISALMQELKRLVSFGFHCSPGFLGIHHSISSKVLLVIWLLLPCIVSGSLFKNVMNKIIFDYSGGVDDLISICLIVFFIFYIVMVIATTLKIMKTCHLIRDFAANSRPD